jgi:hypothetical protein
MNIFQRGKAAIARLFSQDKPEPHSAAARKTLPETVAHMIRLWTPKGTHFFGPAARPDRDYSHVSRQSCRHFLRGLWFAKVSEMHPLMSRRDRRRLSRIYACLEYRETVREDPPETSPEPSPVTSPETVRRLLQDPEVSIA